TMNNTARKDSAYETVVDRSPGVWKPTPPSLDCIVEETRPSLRPACTFKKDFALIRRVMSAAPRLLSASPSIRLRPGLALRALLLFAVRPSWMWLLSQTWL